MSIQNTRLQKERVHSFLQVRFNVLPRVRFASIMNQKDY